MKWYNKYVVDEQQLMKYRSLKTEQSFDETNV